MRNLEGDQTRRIQLLAPSQLSPHGHMPKVPLGRCATFGIATLVSKYISNVGLLLKRWEEIIEVLRFSVLVALENVSDAHEGPVLKKYLKSFVLWDLHFWTELGDLQRSWNDRRANIMGFGIFLCSPCSRNIFVNKAVKKLDMFGIVCFYRIEQ